MNKKIIPAKPALEEEGLSVVCLTQIIISQDGEKQILPPKANKIRNTFCTTMTDPDSKSVSPILLPVCGFGLVNFDRVNN